MKFATVRKVLHPVSLKVPHWVAVTGSSLISAFVGAAGGYLEAIPASEWLHLPSPSSIVPIAVGAGVAGVTALLSQAALLLKQWAAKNQESNS